MLRASPPRMCFRSVAGFRPAAAGLRGALQTLPLVSVPEFSHFALFGGGMDAALEPVLPLNARSRSHAGVVNRRVASYEG